jgi:general secretion pathway protein J
MDQMRVATGFLREIVGRVARQPLEPPATGLLFAGGAQGMSWVGVMPARFGPAGRHFFHLGPERLRDGGTGLVLRFTPWRWEQKAMPDWSQSDFRVLVPDVDTLALSYQGDGFGQGWVQAWPVDAKTLPPRVRLLVSAGGSEWPPIVLAMHPLAGSEGAGGRFVVGAP